MFLLALLKHKYLFHFFPKNKNMLDYFNYISYIATTANPTYTKVFPL